MDLLETLKSFKKHTVQYWKIKSLLERVGEKKLTCRQAMWKISINKSLFQFDSLLISNPNHIRNCNAFVLDFQLINSSRPWVYDEQDSQGINCINLRRHRWQRIGSCHVKACRDIQYQDFSVVKGILSFYWISREYPNMVKYWFYVYALYVTNFHLLSFRIRDLLVMQSTKYWIHNLQGKYFTALWNMQLWKLIYFWQFEKSNHYEVIWSCHSLNTIYIKSSAF